MKSSIRYALLLGGASMLGLASAAQAQDAPAADTEQADTPAEPELVVTGSRVIKNGNNSPSPVTVVQTSDLLTTQPGANLADALNVLPVFAGSRGAGSNPSTGGSASGGNGSANQLNLRNLGITRTLVLMDGLRIPPTLFNGAVDVDLIPQMLVQRVDVVTGGASAVYGSDAVTGVVNYVLDRNFTGLKLEASSGVSEYGDARQIDAGIAWGTNLGENAHFEASYQYHDGSGILRRSDRPWMNLVGVAGAGTTANPFTLYSNLRQRDYPAGGVITTGPLTNQVFKTNGVLSPFTNGTATGTAALQVGGDGGTWDSSLLQPLESHQLFARLDYDFSSTTRAYVQFSGTFKQNENYAEYFRLNNVQLTSNNPFLTLAQQTALAGGGTTFRFRKTMSDGPDRRQHSLSDSDQWMVNAGLAGSIGGFDWGLDYVHGRATLTTRVENNMNQQRLAAALDAVIHPTSGQIVCQASIANPSGYGNCVPLNPFGPTSESQAALDYIYGTTHYRAVTTMDDISGSISGSPFDTWAGPLTVALSGEWRRVSFIASSDATSENLVNCAGIRYNCAATQTVYYLTLPANPKVSQTVWEVAGEMNVPLLRDSAIAKLVDVSGAVRFTRYNTSGDYWTWKVSGNWHLTDNLRFRGTWSRDIRAPTLYELFAERFVVNVNGTDLLTGLSPIIPSINGGNPNLKAEIGKTLTGGVVWKATPQLTFAIDGYQIQVTDAILAVNGGEPSFQAACYASNGTSPYCDLQRRPGSFTDASAANAWTAVYNGLFNISEIKTWGVDAEINYNGRLFGMPVNVRLLGAYQPHLWFRQPNVASRDQAGAAFGPVGFAATPTVRLTGFVRLKPVENFTVDIMQRWRNAMKLQNEGIFAAGSNRMEAFGTTSINLSWSVPSKSEMEFYVNVQNIFDATPPIGGFTGNGTRAGLRDGYAYGDDVRGRYWTAGVKMKF
ncbi:TonB-dependent receptor [Sphingomonas sp. AOB5]|uniref:TonB-dependent receptor domain-containing protein n=1 Tax=Sphingomonas sp. AOB5 TaxID=3034017 RepID=UPI0023F73378|nr:TonB-dependent receptor [Sphingomonas sp. AOB5]MDF7775310.1 TonB-dependent receptor [Sphingomonas sp. AOB5]